MNWVAVFLLSVGGVLGLTLAANAVDTPFYVHALIFTGACVLAGFGLIRFSFFGNPGEPRTGYNDAMESLALKTVFGEACPPVSGAKGMLGHTLGAAGVIETICCVLAMQDQFLPGTPRLSNAAEGTPASLVREPRPVARLKNVLKLNTGFGGLNGALILSHE